MPHYRPLTDRQIQQFKTRDRILASVPHYPETAKGSLIRMKIAARTGQTFTEMVWYYWITRLLRDKLLIRRPGAQLCQPRSVAEQAYHVPPNTPKPKKPKRVVVPKAFHPPLEPALKAANEALELQMKNYSQK